MITVHSDVMARSCKTLFGKYASRTSHCISVSVTLYVNNLAFRTSWWNVTRMNDYAIIHPPSSTPIIQPFPS